MKIAVLSDTHGKHFGIEVPDADTVIHCGDFCDFGQIKDALSFLNWFNALPHKNKIFIAGNHDLPFDNEGFVKALVKRDYPQLTYLEDSGCEIEGVKFWGSPVQPRFFNWAFNRTRGAEIRRHWDLIPEDTDVLITHGPAFHILDRAPRSFDPLEQPPRLSFEHVGCRDLLDKIVKIDPKLHLFGHIHYDGGKSSAGKFTTFCNASIVDENYNVANKPQVFII